MVDVYGVVGTHVFVVSVQYVVWLHPAPVSRQLNVMLYNPETMALVEGGEMSLVTVKEHVPC